MKKHIAILLIIFFVISPISRIAADDTEIYFTSTSSVKPNVLIVFDNSYSMSDNANTGQPYDAAQTYAGSYTSTTIYKQTGGEWNWTAVSNTTPAQLCNEAKNSLNTYGNYSGKWKKQSGSCITMMGCQTDTLSMGNWLNWKSGGNSASRPKVAIAKEAVKTIIGSTYGVNFGMMVFNQGGNGGGCYTGSNGYYTKIRDMEGTDGVYGGLTDQNSDGLVNNRDALLASIGTNANDGIVTNASNLNDTPLAETLYESMLYFKGQDTQFNNSDSNASPYTSPITESCQNSVVIIITDGDSTKDDNSVLAAIGDADNKNGLYTDNGSDYLDDVAKYMYDNDMKTGSNFEGKQNVRTYTIGFGSSVTELGKSLLQRTADANHGHGKYFMTYSAQDLGEALQKIIYEIIEVDSSFVAPVVPVSPENRTYSGSFVYMGFFKPTADAFWYGNVKKYKIDDSGVIKDADGNAATYTDTNGYTYFNTAAKSYWSASADGGNVDKGGVGELLKNRTLSTRKIYTYLGSNTALTNSANAFTKTNTNIVAATLGMSTSTEKDNLIDFIYGYDVYGPTTTATREWILGDILHSRPLIIQYASFASGSEANCSLNKTMIYVGGNDGMLHAFKDCDGSEAWAFIPQDLLPNLKNLTGGVTGNSRTHYYVDSSPKAYIKDVDNDGNIESGDQIIMVFGERRGGSYYYSLDVTDPAAPVYKWRVNMATIGSEPGGQSWSEPSIGKVFVDVSGTNTEKDVFFIGGGYDTAEDGRSTNTQTVSITKGRGIYAINISDGSKEWEYSKTGNSDSNMNYPIPSELTAFDSDGNGYLDTIYVGDTGGQMWRFETGNVNKSLWSATRVFKSNPDSGSDVGRKIFYPPDVTIESEGYKMLFFGTGDREHPKSTGVVDRLYAVQDRAASALSESNLKDATSGAVTLTSSDYGWYIKLNRQDGANNAGEKSLASAAVFSKVAYFTTYTPPTSTEAASACSVNLGTARMWAVNYLTAGGVDLDKDGTVDSRDKIVGNGIPSGIVIGMGASGAYGIIGVGGSVTTTNTSDDDRIIPIYWREVR